MSPDFDAGFKNPPPSTGRVGLGGPTLASSELEVDLWRNSVKVGATSTDKRYQGKEAGRAAAMARLLPMRAAWLSLPQQHRVRGCSAPQGPDPPSDAHAFVVSSPQPGNDERIPGAMRRFTPSPFDSHGNHKCL